jgi:ethanolamine utilization cobalamin adenosyltransferase
MSLVTQAEAERRSDGGTRGPVVLEPGEVLSPSAREYLSAHRVEVTRARTAQGYRTENGTRLREKPETMTHLRGNLLVEKTHPRIRLRGKIDSLEGDILLTQWVARREGYPKLVEELDEVLTFGRNCMRWEVMDEPVGVFRLCGLDENQLRERSHHPEQFYGQSHFLPSWQDGETMLALNRLRTEVRETELAACAAWPNGERTDLIQALNRMSSLIWVQMIRLKAGEYGGGTWKT